MSQTELAISRQTLTDFVTGLAAATPSPGSGAAGAVALALAAGCAAKAFAISHKHAESRHLEQVLEQARSIATIALEAAQRDGEDFRVWLKSQSARAVAALEEDARPPATSSPPPKQSKPATVTPCTPKVEFSRAGPPAPQRTSLPDSEKEPRHRGVQVARRLLLACYTRYSTRALHEYIKATPMPPGATAAPV